MRKRRTTPRIATSSPLEGEVGVAVRAIGDLLVEHGAMPSVRKHGKWPTDRIAAKLELTTALQMWSAARLFLETESAEPVNFGVWLFDELEKKGHSEQAALLAEMWPDRTRPPLEVPEPDTFNDAINALEKAHAKVRAIPANSAYALSSGRRALKTLQDLISELRVSAHVARNLAKPKGGRPKTGGYEFFVEAISLWYAATNRWPPREKLHGALVSLLYALGADDEIEGTSFETFKDALTATKAWYKANSATGGAPLDPMKAKFEVKRTRPRGRKGEKPS